MGQGEIRIALPEEVAALLGGTAQAAADGARRAVVLDLLRQGRLSQGSAARVLGLTRHDAIDLIATHDVPAGPSSVAELRQDVDAALAAARAPAGGVALGARLHGGDRGGREPADPVRAGGAPAGSSPTSSARSSRPRSGPPPAPAGSRVRRRVGQALATTGSARRQNSSITVRGGCCWRKAAWIAFSHNWRTSPLVEKRPRSRALSSVASAVVRFGSSG